MPGSRTRISPQTVGLPSSRKLLLEIFGLMLLFWAVFLVFSLATYSPNDPGLNHVISTKRPISNGGGMFGAYIGGLLVDMFGLAAPVWPLLFAVWGISCISALFTMPWWRWGGFILLGACLSALGADTDLSLLGIDGGGMFGPRLLAEIIPFLGPYGAVLLWLFCLFLSVELCLGIPWMTIITGTAGLLSRLFAKYGITGSNISAAVKKKLFRRDNHEDSAKIPPITLYDITPEQSGTDQSKKNIPDTLRTRFRETNPYCQSPSALNVSNCVDTSNDPPWLPESDHINIDLAGSSAQAHPQSSSAACRAYAPAAPPTPHTVTPDFESPFPAKNFDTSTASQSQFQFLESTDSPKTPDTFLDELEKALDKGELSDADAVVGQVGSIAPEMAAATPALPPCRLPDTSLLTPPTKSDELPSRDFMRIRGEQLMSCLKDFNVNADLVRVTPGPVVTMFELRPSPGTKVSRILSLNEDIALNLKALSVRIQVLPGSDTVGVEIPNETRATVNFRTVLESDAFTRSSALLTLALGVNIGGTPVTADLAKMPHLLVGGTTGSGKSVCINAFLISLLFKANPDELKILMVDPKRVEMAMYADLPHLIHPVVNEPAMAKNALDWAVHEMERRYDLLARLGVRKFDAYNEKLRSMGNNRPLEYTDFEPMPYLVIVIDELADLMMSAGKDVEASIVRLAQLARAAGIHLIVATQRPSVDVVTGLIKANFPSRISFRVANGHDSRTILDSQGAELLLGNGDMLVKPNGGGKPFRMHGPFVSDEDVEAVVNFWKAQRKPVYKLDFSEWGQASPDDPRRSQGNAVSANTASDDLYGDIVEFALTQGKGLSISKLQRQFRIGFNKAARYMEQMQQDGIIAPPGHANRSREIINDWKGCND